MPLDIILFSFAPLRWNIAFLNLCGVIMLPAYIRIIWKVLHCEVVLRQVITTASFHGESLLCLTLGPCTDNWIITIFSGIGLGISYNGFR